MSYHVIPQERTFYSIICFYLICQFFNGMGFPRFNIVYYFFQICHIAFREKWIYRYIKRNRIGNFFTMCKNFLLSAATFLILLSRAAWTWIVRIYLLFHTYSISTQSTWIKRCRDSIRISFQINRYPHLF